MAHKYINGFNFNVEELRKKLEKVYGVGNFNLSTQVGLALISVDDRADMLNPLDAVVEEHQKVDWSLVAEIDANILQKEQSISARRMQDALAGEQSEIDYIKTIRGDIKVLRANRANLIG